jgi:putative phosphoribosyl transferase
MRTTFRNRAEAGRLLAAALNHYADRPGVVVLGLPRGGVSVAFEVARHLHAPLDILLVRKLGVPGCAELAMGAIASGGVTEINERVVQELQIPLHLLHEIAAAEEKELKRREEIYRGHGASVEIGAKTVILVDDGIATGSTLRAAIRAVRHRRPTRVVVAVPVASPSSRHDFADQVDELVALIAPEDIDAVGQAYQDFEPVDDAEVTRLMEDSAAADTSRAG